MRKIQGHFLSRSNIKIYQYINNPILFRICKEDSTYVLFAYVLQNLSPTANSIITHLLMVEIYFSMMSWLVIVKTTKKRVHREMKRKMTILSYFTPNFIVLCTRINRSDYKNIFCENISSYLKDLLKLSQFGNFLPT